MDFRKLIYFEAVCREKSFTKAAQRLHITQPSVTMAVRDLEHDLNVCLIDRRRGELTPTPEGEYILQKARHLIQELEQTEQEIHTFLQKQKGGVRIGYAIQMRNALSKLLNRFRAEYSDITVAEHESSTPAIIAQLQRGALDLGIIAVSKGWEKALHIHPLYQGELRVCVSRQNPLSQAQSVTLEQFEHQPLVSLAIKNPLDSYIFRILQDAYPDKKLALRPCISTMMLESYFRNIANNQGVGLTYYDSWFTPSLYQHSAEEKPPCVFLPFDPPCFYSVAVVFMKNRPLSQQGKRLVDFIENAV